MDTDPVALLQRAFGIRDEAAAQLAQVAREQTFAPGDVLLRQDERGREFYVIVAGQVAVTRHLTSPDSQTLAVRGPGEIIGEMSLLDDAPRLASARALTGVRTLVFDETTFQALLAEPAGGPASVAPHHCPAARVRPPGHR